MYVLSLFMSLGARLCSSPGCVPPVVAPVYERPVIVSVIVVDADGWLAGSWMKIGTSYWFVLPICTGARLESSVIVQFPVFASEKASFVIEAGSSVKPAGIAASSVGVAGSVIRTVDGRFWPRLSVARRSGCLVTSL